MKVLKDTWNAISPFNLLDPVYKHDIRVMVTENSDIRVFIETPRSREEAMDVCNSLVKAAHLVAMKHQLRMVMEKPEDK